VNTLISFFNEKKREKNVLLIDCDSKPLINAGIIKEIIEKTLIKIDETWNEVITISTDSASYMKAFVESIKNNNNKIIHINDISHLIHVSIFHGFGINEMVKIRKLIIKFRNLFVNSNVLLHQFNELLNQNARNDKKIRQVVDHRWFSYYLTLNDIIEVWPILLEFIETHKSTKIEKIRELLNETNSVKVLQFLSAFKPFLNHYIYVKNHSNLINRIVKNYIK